VPYTLGLCPKHPTLRSEPLVGRNPPPGRQPSRFFADKRFHRQSFWHPPATAAAAGAVNDCGWLQPAVCVLRFLLWSRSRIPSPHAPAAETLLLRPGAEVKRLQTLLMLLSRSLWHRDDAS
jgi:hypothetical protein